MKATPRPTNRYAKRPAKPEPIRIRWRKVLIAPAVLVVGMALIFGVLFALNQNELNTISKKTAHYKQQLVDYQTSHPNIALLKETLAKADQLAAGYMYEEAISLLKQNAVLQTETTVIERISRYQTANDSLVIYTDSVPVIFFHSLIVDPKIAFGKSSSNPSGYRSLNVTIYEFEKMINEMSDRGYIMVSFNDVYGTVNGIMTRKVLKLPSGKIPFILMEDENAYTDPMPLDGFARGLIIQNGEIVARSLTAEGLEKTDVGDIVPIVEKFVKEHPGFSFRGARGVLSLTGYAGAFGYRLTNANDITNATALAKVLKEKGWIFGCTSFNDDKDTYLLDPTPGKIDADLRNWDIKIKPIVGGTPIFVSPFGNLLSSQNLTVIKNHGYLVFLSDTNNMTEYVNNGVLHISRISVTGDALRNNAAYFNANFFNVSNVLDPARN